MAKELKPIKKIVFFLFSWQCLLFAANHAVTYDFSGGRFGDNLLTYLHAKWIAYHHQIPLLYKPFLYSSDLVLHEQEIPYTLQEGLTRIKSRLERRPPYSSPIPILYLCPYFPDDQKELREGKYFHFDVDWKDIGFRKIAREMIAPLKPIDLIYPPKDTINIALHIREGGGFDTDHTRLHAGLKLPPLYFYCDGLSKILTLFPGKSIYCFLFTDAQDPEHLIEQLQKSIPSNQGIIFDYRKKSNHHTKNVLEDFFSLFHFDVLIRPQSNFSTVPSLIHDFAILYHPIDYSLYKNTVIIEKVNMEIHQELYNRLMQ